MCKPVFLFCHNFQIKSVINQGNVIYFPMYGFFFSPRSDMRFWIMAVLSIYKLFLMFYLKYSDIQHLSCKLSGCNENLEDLKFVFDALIIISEESEILTPV